VHQTLRVSIDHVALIPCEPDQSQTGFIGQTNGQPRRRRNRGHQTNAHSCTLLHHLEARATGHHDKSLPEGDFLSGQRANQLVEGIMPADILANGDNALARNSKGRRMHGAR